MAKPVNIDNWQNRALSVNEVCAVLGIGRATLYRKLEKGLIPKPNATLGFNRWHGRDIEQLISAPASIEQSSAEPLSA